MQRPWIPGIAALALLSGCVGGLDVDLADDATATEYFAAAQELIENEELEDAADLLEELVDEFPASPEARGAEWLAAEIAYRLDDLKDAGEAYQEFHETHPLDRLGELENRMYDIGVRLFDEGESGLMGLGIFSTSEDGIKFLEWLSEELAQGSRADDALIFIARARHEDGEHEDVVTACDRLLEEHPDSEWLLPTLYLLGSAHLKLNRGPEYDRTALIESAKAFGRYVREAERDEARQAEKAERIAAAKEQLAEIDRRLAEKSLLIGEFYISLERYVAAESYLTTAADGYPETEAGKRARALLDEIEPLVEQEKAEQEP